MSLKNISTMDSKKNENSELENNILVLMSTYNGEKYVEQQLDTILAQQNCNVNILIRDDGSSDYTPQILKRYAEEYDNITIMHDNKNIGPAKSFIKLLLEAPEYDFYAFADQDDIWYSDKLWTGCRILKQYVGPVLYFSNAELADANGNDLNILVNKRKKNFLNYETVLCGGQFMGCTMVFNKELAEAVKSVGAPMAICMHDNYLAGVCAILGGYIYYDHTPHMLYRLHNNTVGVQIGIIDKIKNRIEYIFVKKEIPLYMQAKEWMRLYGNNLTGERKKFLQLLINMQCGMLSRLKLCFSREIHFRSLKASIVNRIAFLLGNK